MGEGEVALIVGALTGIFALVGVMINAWYGRRLDRDRELRQWRLAQLHPTLDFLNGAFGHYAELDNAFSRLLEDYDEENISMFVHKLRSEGLAFQHLGHSIIIARSEDHGVSKQLNAAFEAYNACNEDMVQKMRKAIAAKILDRPAVSIMPSWEVFKNLMDSILDLNQSVERYAFGRVGGPIYVELKDKVAWIEGEIARLEAESAPVSWFSLLRFRLSNRWHRRR